MPTEREARALMGENMAHNPEFEGGYWYPADDEYRFIYVDPTALPARAGDRLAVYQMEHEERDGRKIPLLVAFVRPQDMAMTPAPQEWGEGRLVRPDAIGTAA